MKCSIFLLFFVFVNGQVTQKNEDNNGTVRITLPKDCGTNRYNNTVSRIVKGTVASLGQFPWIVRIGLQRHNRIVLFCGGTLITKYYVITAAHCVQVEVNIVRLGENYLNTPIDCDKSKVCAPRHQDIKINRFIIHDKYCRRLHENDYAVVELRDEAKFNDFVRPVCFPTSPLARDDLKKDLLTISGWGLTDSILKTSPNYLMYITAPLVDSKECNVIYFKKLQDNQLCIGYSKGKDSCNGDSGGPVTKTVTENGIKRTYLVGLVSYGLPHCGNGPAVYTDVSRFAAFTMNWMKKN